MAWTTADIPDQTGRVAVVTGANGGLGLATAPALGSLLGECDGSQSAGDPAVDAIALLRVTE